MTKQSLSMQQPSGQPSIRSLTFASQQRGEGITSIVAIIILLVLCIKIGLAIVPAQITDYQLSNAIANELRKANNNKENKQQLISGIQSQLSINGYHDINIDEMYTIVNETPGYFMIHKDYEVESNFLPNVFIVNRFKGDIEPAGTE